MLEALDIMKQLKTSQILDDCQRSLDLLETVPDSSFDLGDIDLWGDWDCRDWVKSHEDAVALREEYGSKFYIKKDLRMAV